MSIDYGSYGPMAAKETSLKYYWSVSTLLLLWGLGYVLLIAEALFIMRPEDFVRLVNVGDDPARLRRLRAALCRQWVVGLTVTERFHAGSLGAVGLLLAQSAGRSRCTLSPSQRPVVIFFRGFLVDNRGGSVEGSNADRAGRGIFLPQRLRAVFRHDRALPGRPAVKGQGTLGRERLQVRGPDEFILDKLPQVDGAELCLLLGRHADLLIEVGRHAAVARLDGVEGQLQRTVCRLPSPVDSVA
jgi:hypothetical protein